MLSSFAPISMIRASTIIFSLCVHGALFGGLYIFSNNTLGSGEVVYHVSLAEFAAPAEPEIAQPETPPPPPEPEPEPEPEAEPEPKPEPETVPEPKKEEVKPISPKKKEVAKPKPKAKPKKVTKPKTPPASPAPPKPTGPVGRNIGGLMAFDAKQVDTLPSIVKRAAPKYPNRAKRMNIQGKVIVHLVVDTSGNPVSVSVVSADPQGYFEDAALVAAKKMRFIPGKIKGKIVNTLVQVPFVFKLR